MFEENLIFFFISVLSNLLIIAQSIGHCPVPTLWNTLKTEQNAQPIKQIAHPVGNTAHSAQPIDHTHQAFRAYLPS
jgi:hypothetical protein